MRSHPAFALPRRWLCLGAFLLSTVHVPTSYAATIIRVARQIGSVAATTFSDGCGFKEFVVNADGSTSEACAGSCEGVASSATFDTTFSIDRISSEIRSISGTGHLKAAGSSGCGANVSLELDYGITVDRSTQISIDLSDAPSGDDKTHALLLLDGHELYCRTFGSPFCPSGGPIDNTPVSTTLSAVLSTGTEHVLQIRFNCNVAGSSDSHQVDQNFVITVHFPVENAGTEIHWNNPAGGLFDDPSNWLPNEVPSAVEDTAIVDLGGAVTIDFTAGASLGRLLVRQTAVDLFGAQMQLSNAALDTPSLSIGDLGEVALLEGILICVHADIGHDPNGGPAALELFEAPGGQTELHASGTVLVGPFAQGRVNVDNARFFCDRLQIDSLTGTSSVDFRGPRARGGINFIDIGVRGAATLSILDGADVACDDVSMGIGPLGASTLVVQGTGEDAGQTLRSTLNAEHLKVGDLAVGVVQIRAGGLVELERLTLGSDDPASKPLLTVTGGTPSDPSRLKVESLAKVLGADTRVTVSEKAQVNFLGDAEIRSRGLTRFDVIGPDTACTIRGTLTIAATSGAVADVDVSEGGIFSQESGHAATLRVGEGANPGSIRITHPIERLNDPVPSQMHFTNVEIANGSVVVQGAGRLGGDQTITVRGRLEVDSNLLNSSNVVCDQLNIKATGVVRCCPSGHIVATTIVNEVGARIEGDANVTGNVVTSGLVRVGCSPGTMTIDGDYEQTETGVLEIEVAGRDAGQFDVLKVTGNATLAGTVDLKFIDGFVPQPGDSVDFVQVDGTITGKLTGSKFIDIPVDVAPPADAAADGGSDAGGGIADGTSNAIAQAEVKWEVTPEGTCRMTVTNVTALDNSARLLPAECGAGLCGAGVVPMLPATLVGLMSFRHCLRRGARRRLRGYDAERARPSPAAPPEAA